tara:strand:+ start:2472 stop:3683 length:1212 start_codon:yes stop_codon:yes gene_type:complete
MNSLNIDPRGDLQKLVTAVQDRAARTQDMIAPTTAINFGTLGTDGGGANSRTPQLIKKGQQRDAAPTGNRSALFLSATGQATRICDINDVAFGQIAAYCGIDVRLARRLQQSYPATFDHLINTVLETEASPRMLRTLEHGELGERANGSTHVLRAFVSDSFKTFDDVDLLTTALPPLMDSAAEWRVVSGQLTDRRMYLRLRSAVQVAEPAIGDHMANGVGISNSEVGHGSVSVFQMVYTLACLNGMRTERQSRSSHVTSARAADGEYQLLSAEAKDADNHALALKLRDLVTAYAERESFDNAIEAMREAHQLTTDAPAQALAEATVKLLGGPNSDASRVLDGLMQTAGQSGYAGRPISKATLVNAVTAVANRADADDADEWHRAGGKILALPTGKWEALAHAA